MPRQTFSRRRLLKGATLAVASTIAAPYMRTSCAAGKLSLGLWDHWVPNANETLKKICNGWAAKNKVDLQIDFITSIGNKIQLTAAAEAQARTGHDVFQHAGWMVHDYRNVLEPTDQVVADLSRKYGPPDAMSEYLAKHNGSWYAVPATVGSQVKPCCSRLDLYKQHAGIDLSTMFPANDGRDKTLTDAWNWESYLASAEKLLKAGYPVGLPMGQTTDTVDWVGALFRSFGAIFIDEKDTIKVDSGETRAALEYLKQLMAVNPPDVYAWDDAGNNKWLISGKGSSIMNPPSAWAVAKRDNPKIAAQCWTHDMPRGLAGRYVGQLPFFYGIWTFSQNKEAAKDLLVHLSEKDQARQLVAASHGYDIPPFRTYLDFDTWSTEEPPLGTLYNYPMRGDQQGNIAGFPARPAVAVQMYNLALQPIMVAKVTQGGVSIDDAIKWAEAELEAYLRT